MKKKEIRTGTNISLPEGVEQSLCACGGVIGLISLLPEDSDIESLSSTYRALADNNRIKILTMLSIQPLCVCVIRAILEISDSRLSYHLSVLKKTGLIAGEQKGTWITYSLTDKGREWLDSGKNIADAK
ncbi:MAG: metalloregulator ArsR/SmtB family transcription factor [Methanomicrobium sp.]|nr:metalloregulator ArsR/SmtB family transcription factor [Methanomicrobium sp.]